MWTATGPSDIMLRQVRLVKCNILLTPGGPRSSVMLLLITCDNDINVEIQGALSLVDMGREILIASTNGWIPLAKKL